MYVSGTGLSASGPFMMQTLKPSVAYAVVGYSTRQRKMRLLLAFEGIRYSQPVHVIVLCMPGLVAVRSRYLRRPNSLIIKHRIQSRVQRWSYH